MTAALDVLDTKAVAALLRVTAEHVCKLVRRGKLRGFKPGKTTLFMASDVLAYIRGEHGEDEASGTLKWDERSSECRWTSIGRAA